MELKEKKLARVSVQCVACGCCEKACPTKAITISHGVRAIVTPSLCVGCGRCAKACPASVITIGERGQQV